MSKCQLCGFRLATYRCRRCGRRVCGICIVEHGLCRSCYDYLVRVRKGAFRG